MKPNKTMNEEEFDKLMEKYQKGLLRGEEKRLVDKWFDHLENKGDSHELAEADRLQMKSTIFATIRSGKRSRFIGNYRMGYRIAASLLLVAGLTYLVLYYAGQENHIAATKHTVPSTKTNKVILADGSIVWLKGNSRLDYPASFSGNSRTVSLQGEGLFEVAKDPKHPFIIQCGELTTTVLGTSFNIKTTEKSIEVVVLTGKVSLTSSTDKKGIILVPNQKAVYSEPYKQLEKTEISTEEKAATIQGTEYAMKFEDATMKEIIERMEDKFNVEVFTSDVKLQNCMLTADFTDQSLDQTIHMIAQALGCEYSIQANRITLKGEGCN